MHTAAMIRQTRWLPPLVGAAGSVRRTWLSAPQLVGLDPNDPGAGWGQAPTAQEKAQGYKKTDVMTLQINANALKQKVDGLLSDADPAATDPGSLAALKALAGKCSALASAVAALANGTNPVYSQYPILLVQYNALAAEFAGYGIEEAAPPPVPSKGGAPPVVVPPKTVKPAATPTSPVIAKKAGGDWDWLLYVSAAAAVLGVLVGTKVIRL